MLSSRSTLLNCIPGCAKLRTVSPICRSVERPKEDLEEDARTAGWFATASKQIVQQQRFAQIVFLQGFARHSTDHIALFGEARFPGLLVSQRNKDLGRNRVLTRPGGSATTFSSAISSSFDIRQF